MSEQPYFTIYGEDWNYESNTNGTWVDRESFDTLAQQLQEAERLLQRIVSHHIEGNIRETVRDCVNGRPDVQDIYEYCDEIETEIDAFLAGNGGKA